jgi:hypothetical protein
MIVFKQFSIYPEIRWIAVAGAGSKDAENGIVDDPGLDDFSLLKFQQLRKQYDGKKNCNYTIMLTGNDKTNIFINGPDTLLDEMIKKMPGYIGKSWTDINSIRLGEES